MQPKRKHVSKRRGMKAELRKMTTFDVRKLVDKAIESRSPEEFLLARGLNARTLWNFHIRLPSHFTGTTGSPKHVFAAGGLRKLGYSAQELAINHYSLPEIIEAGYPLHELVDAVKKPEYLESFGFGKKAIEKAIATRKALLLKRTKHAKKLGRIPGASEEASKAREMRFELSQKEIDARLGKKKKE